MAPFGGKPGVGAQLLTPAVEVGAAVVVAMVVVELVAALQSQMWPIPQGQEPAGKNAQALAHLASLPPKSSAPAAMHPAIVVELCIEVVVEMGKVLVALLVEEAVLVVIVVVLLAVVVPGAAVVLLLSVGSTVMSAQLRNCSPQPQCTFPPQFPGQSPRTPQAAASYPLESKTSA